MCFCSLHNNNFTHTLSLPALSIESFTELSLMEKLICQTFSRHSTIHYHEKVLHLHRAFCCLHYTGIRSAKLLQPAHSYPLSRHPAHRPNQRRHDQRLHQFMQPRRRRPCLQNDDKTRYFPNLRQFFFCEFPYARNTYDQLLNHDLFLLEC